MYFLLLSIAFSVSVSVLLKLARRFDLDMRQAIAANYVVAALLAVALLQPQPATLLAAPWPPLVILLLLGTILPAMFWALAVSVRRCGVVRTDAAMRLSLLVPLLAAFTLFGEAFNWARGLGLALGLAAIALLVSRPRNRGQMADPAWSRVLLVVFVGMGAIDILFKQMARLGTASASSVLFAVFVLAAFLSLLAVAWLYWRSAAQWRARHLLAGVALGTLNFGNILFYIKAHRVLPEDPALVFATMNIGVIVLATAVGVIAFRERLNRAAIIGLALAVIAVAILARA